MIIFNLGTLKDKHNKGFMVMTSQRERERLCFINRHFADLNELRGFTKLVIIIVKNL